MSAEFERVRYCDWREERETSGLFRGSLRAAKEHRYMLSSPFSQFRFKEPSALRELKVVWDGCKVFKVNCIWE